MSIRPMSACGCSRRQASSAPYLHIGAWQPLMWRVGAQRLLIDVGNRRIKWRLTGATDRHSLGQGAFVYSIERLSAQLTSSLAALKQPDSVWVSCVGGARLEAVLAAYCRQRWAQRPRFLRSERSRCGLQNGYTVSDTLGVDRWLAMIGARSRSAGQEAARGGLIVIDAGTAVTVDLVDADGWFVGGVIFPGMVTMRSGLVDNAKQIDEVEPPPGGSDSGLPTLTATARDTRRAVDGGILCAVVGGIDLAVDMQARQLSAAPGIVITGGDAQRCLRYLSRPARYFENLVLDGMQQVIEDVQRSGEVG